MRFSMYHAGWRHARGDRARAALPLDAPGPANRKLTMETALAREKAPQRLNSRRGSSVASPTYTWSGTPQSRSGSTIAPASTGCVHVSAVAVGEVGEGDDGHDASTRRP